MHVHVQFTGDSVQNQLVLKLLPNLTGKDHWKLSLFSLERLGKQTETTRSSINLQGQVIQRTFYISFQDILAYKLHHSAPIILQCLPGLCSL